MRAPCAPSWAFTRTLKPRRSRQRSADARARPSGDRGSGGRFSATLRAYAPWTIRTLELDGAADLPAVCVWLKPDRKDAGFHFEWSRNLGTAAAAGIQSRDCHARVPIEFKKSRLALAACLHSFFRGRGQSGWDRDSEQKGHLDEHCKEASGENWAQPFALKEKLLRCFREVFASC